MNKMPGTMTRFPTASGKFYPGDKQALERMLEMCFGQEKPTSFASKSSNTRAVLGGIVPHAGYAYSCNVASKTVESIFGEGLPDTVIVLGIDHAGRRQNAIMTRGQWQTPLGNVEVDQELASEINRKKSLSDDANFFAGEEHSIEVQLPLIQYAARKASKSPKIVPISVNTREASKINQISDAIATAIKKSRGRKNIAIFASSDMSHEYPTSPGRPARDIIAQKQRDVPVINAFAMDNWKGILEKGKDSTICGLQNIATLVNVGKRLGYNSARPLKYVTSCEVTRAEDCNYNVGYFAGVVEK